MKNIVLIGAGNVGFHLGQRLFEKGINILQVFSRTFSKAQYLAKQINSQPINDLTKINSNAEGYILAIKDDALSDVAQQLSRFNLNHAILAHTSGATPSSIFKPYFQNHGVFYPLQTFSVKRPANFDTLPMCIDGSNPQTKANLMILAKAICPNIYAIDDQQRAILHVAAVFVNNFTNHLFAIGENIVGKEQLPFELLKPLIQETVSKIANHPAKSMQTGPAIRKDNQTIQRHLAFLERYPDYRNIYQLLTKSIQIQSPIGD